MERESPASGARLRACGSFTARCYYRLLGHQVHLSGTAAEYGRSYYHSSLLESGSPGLSFGARLRFRQHRGSAWIPVPCRCRHHDCAGDGRRAVNVLRRHSYTPGCGYGTRARSSCWTEGRSTRCLRRSAVDRPSPFFTELPSGEVSELKAVAKTKLSPGLSPVISSLLAGQEH